MGERKTATLDAEEPCGIIAPVQDPPCPPLPADTKTLAIAREGAASDHSRRQQNLYDPTDIIGGVSDAGLDRGPIELLRHLDLAIEGTRTTRYDTEDAQPHLKNRAQNPLDSYYSRHQLAPEDNRLNKLYWRTGRKVRADWSKAGYEPSLVGAVYSGVPTTRSTAAASDEKLDALNALTDALRWVPEVPRLCVVAVCCADQWAGDWAKLRGTWPRPRDALHYLRVGLDALRDWYGDTRPA